MHDNLNPEPKTEVTIAGLAMKHGRLEAVSRELLNQIDTSNPDSLRNVATLLDRVIDILQGSEPVGPKDGEVLKALKKTRTFVDSPLDRYIGELSQLNSRAGRAQIARERAQEEVDLRGKSINAKLWDCIPGTVPTFDPDLLDGITSVAAEIQFARAVQTDFSFDGEPYRAERIPAKEPDKGFTLEIIINPRGRAIDSHIGITGNPALAREFVLFVQTSLSALVGLPDELANSKLPYAINPSVEEERFQFHGGAPTNLKGKCDWIERAMESFFRAKGYEITKVDLAAQNTNLRSRAQQRIADQNEAENRASEEFSKLNKLALTEKDVTYLRMAIATHAEALEKFEELTEGETRESALDPMRDLCRIRLAPSDQLKDLKSYFDGLNKGINDDDSRKVRRSLDSIAREFEKISERLNN